MKLLGKGLTETDIQRQILDGLKQVKEGFFWRNNNAGVFSNGTYRKPSHDYCPLGVADILGVYKGRFVAIEVKQRKAFQQVASYWQSIPDPLTYVAKTKSEQHRLNQVIFLEKVRRAGGIGFFTFSYEHAIGCLINWKLFSVQEGDVK